MNARISTAEAKRLLVLMMDQGVKPPDSYARPGGVDTAAESYALLLSAAGISIAEAQAAIATYLLDADDTRFPTPWPSAGKILAVLEAKRFKTVRVLSFDWHPVILGKIPQGQSKAMAIAKAQELWPDEDWIKSAKAKNHHDGMIDAALIAEYGRRITFPPLVPVGIENDELPWT